MDRVGPVFFELPPQLVVLEGAFLREDGDEALGRVPQSLNSVLRPGRLFDPPNPRPYLVDRQLKQVLVVRDEVLRVL